jgi:protein O-GlcNAc transferase
VLLMQQGRFTDAAHEFERTVSLRPDNGEAWAQLGTVYKEAGEPAKAIDALRRAISLLPAQPSPHITLAAILAEQGDHAGAASERKTAADLSRVAVSRQRANFALDSGRTLLGRGQIPEAIAQFQTAVSADPTMREAHLALAEALSRAGRTADSLVERRKAESLENNTVGATGAPR